MTSKHLYSMVDLHYMMSKHLYIMVDLHYMLIKPHYIMYVLSFYVLVFIFFCAVGALCMFSYF